MNTAHFLRYLGLAVAMVLSGCGGGDESVTPAEAALMLSEQSAECFAIAAGRTSPDKFNAASAKIALVAVDSLCMAWPIRSGFYCQAIYSAMSRPYSDPAQCKVDAPN